MESFFVLFSFAVVFLVVIDFFRYASVRLTDLVAPVGVCSVFVALLFIAGCSSSEVDDADNEVAELPSESAANSEPTPEAAPEPAPEPPVDSGSWRTFSRTNPLDDSTTVGAVLDASEGVGGFLDDEEFVLTARCLSNTTAVYVNWHDYLGDDDTSTIRANEKRVTYRFPPTEATSELWNVSTDNDSTFATDPVPFLRQLVASERLVMQTTPYNESPSTAIFDLTGAREAILAIAEECGWTLPEGD